MLRTMYRVILHPFEEFYDVRIKRKNYLAVSLVVVVMLFFASVIEYQMTDFIFNHNRIEQLNIWIMLLKTVLVFLLWVLSNWAFCTLFDGEGSLNQIFCISALALLPYVIAILLKTIISTFLITEEGIFLTWLVVLGELYSGFLMICGMQMIHGYTIRRTLFSAVISVVGIAVILFIITLLFSLLQQFCAFFITIFTEISLMVGG